MAVNQEKNEIRQLRNIFIVSNVYLSDYSQPSFLKDGLVVHAHQWLVKKTNFKKPFVTITTQLDGNYWWWAGTFHKLRGRDFALSG